MILIFALLPFIAQDRTLAEKCGSEIAWKATAEEAAAEAKASKRLILWYVPTVQNTPMDRKDVIDTYMKAGPWMMRDVIELIGRNYVPLRMAGAGELAKRCGVTRMEFIEPGIVFLTADLQPVHKVDRITTFQEEWFVNLLRQVSGPGADKEVPAAGPPLARARALRWMGRYDEALKALDGSSDGDSLCEAGILLLRQGKSADALARLEGVSGARTLEASFLRGAALHLLNRDPDGREEWKKLLAHPDSPWAWKADAELRRIGPFVRCFEELQALPSLEDKRAGSTTRASDNYYAVTLRSVAFLLRNQRANGSWDDSTYVFGGEDSIPNVNMSVSALAATALLAWKQIDRGGVDAALARAWPYLSDEGNMALDDEDEIIWGYAYRLRYFAALATADPAKRDACVKKMNELVGLVVKLQKKSGIWRHEYDAPFTTASVIQALAEAAAAGATVPELSLKKAGEALATCRNRKGVFSYGFPAGPGFVVEGAAGRMPLCELGLLLCGRSNQAALKESIDLSFRHHGLLEKIRKYDNHADAYHNGGFFFWYDVLARAEAIRRLEKDRDPLLDRMHALVLSIPEIDGTFVDSHELGKSYGTAMALLTLKACVK